MTKCLRCHDEGSILLEYKYVQKHNTPCQLSEIPLHTREIRVVCPDCHKQPPKPTYAHTPYVKVVLVFYSIVITWLTNLVVNYTQDVYVYLTVGLLQTVLTTVGVYSIIKLVYTRYRKDTS